MSITERAYFLPGDTFTRDGVTHRQFHPTQYTAGPWSLEAQHGAPPAALLTHALELAAEEAGLPAAEGRFTRVSTDLLSVVPLTTLTATARVVRPGKRISLLEAVITDTDSGREVVRGSAWWIRTQELPLLSRELAPAVPGPEQAVHDTEFYRRWGGPYIDNLNVRTAAVERTDITSPPPTPDIPGALPEVWAGGPVYWLNTEIPVVAEHTDTPWMLMTKLLDSANGLGTGLSPEHWNFMNLDTTIYLNRLPVGDWIGVLPDANYGPDGVGTTVTRIYDAQGPVGSANQTIMVHPR